MKNVTLCFLTKTENSTDYVCLAMKKRGFGMGKWNGVGGKVQNESVEQATIREAKEEIGVDLLDLKKVALLNFITMKHKCHVFLADKWEGEPTETEEMKPEWFAVDAIPYHEMWDDDKVWLQRVLDGKTITGEFHFDENDNLVAHTIEETSF